MTDAVSRADVGNVMVAAERLGLEVEALTARTWPAEHHGEQIALFVPDVRSAAAALEQAAAALRAWSGEVNSDA